MSYQNKKIKLYLFLISIFFFFIFVQKTGEGKNNSDKKFSRNLSSILKKTDNKIEQEKSSLTWSDDETKKESAEEDKTLSPYFYIPGSDSQTDTLPLKETSADVKIAGAIAYIKVKQVYQNSGNKPIEAIYVFPASTRVAVHGMRMKIGERVIEAEVERRKEAKEKYEKAKEEGKRASLLEEERPNVFKMNVANIMPGDRIETELDYSEMLVPTEGVYEFVYPTVVGPRYSGGADPDKDDWISNPYLNEGAKETYKFNISINLATGIPIRDVFSPSHRVNINYTGKNSAEITLGEDGGGNRDFILRYRLAEDKIETGALVYDDGNEKFFTVMIEPPPRPKQSQIPPREYIFLLDVSGSMIGFPLNTAKELIRNLLSKLRKNDYFNLVLFSGDSYRWRDVSQPATEGNINEVLFIVGNQYGGGGTELMEGLKSAYSIKEPEEKAVARTVVVITDGYVGVEAKVFKFVRENLSKANLFAFGIGTSVNRGLIEGMARAGMGESFVVDDPARAMEVAKKFEEYVSSPVLTDIKVEFSDFVAEEVYPRKVPDLLARRPIVISGKFKSEAKGDVIVKGISGSGEIIQKVNIASAESGEKAKGIKFLWARKWVELLEDQMSILPDNEELKNAVASLGLHYSLLTSQTSFVAVDSQIVNKTGKIETVKQPLPLPAKVSRFAVGSVGYGGMKGGIAGSGYGYGYAYGGGGHGVGVAKLSVQNSTAGVTGSLSKEAILKFIRLHMSEVKNCYKSYKDKNPNFNGDGKVVVKFKISSTGQVLDAQVVSSTLNNPEIENCLIESMKKWIFSSLSGGSEISMTYPFVFSPDEDEENKK